MPDLQTANRFISGSYDKYTTCISSYEIVTTATSAVSTQAGAATGLVTQFVGSLPQQVMSGLTLAVGLVLMVYGYKLVRPVNFAAGAYLGWTASLILLTIFAPTLASCPAVLAVGTCSGLLVGLLCAMKRASVMAVLGVVAGEMVGDVFFKTFLASLAPEYVAFGCIGFFAVLLAVLSAYAGDFAFQVRARAQAACPPVRGVPKRRPKGILPAPYYCRPRLASLPVCCPLASALGWLLPPTEQHLSVPHPAVGRVRSPAQRVLIAILASTQTPPSAT